MILRLEQYLARVAGGTGAIPESPETNTEAYLAILAGENRQAPEPITRLDMYLCNLIGGNYPIPTPNTRIEQYLAKACGLDIEVPTPITREEQLWHAIAQSSWQLTTLTGALPLSFKSKGTPLTDYKLYGTSEGAGVETESGEPAGYKLPMTVESGEESTATPIYIGDSKLMAEEYVDYGEQKVYKRTENLFDKSTAILGKEIYGSRIIDSVNWAITPLIPAEPQSYYSTLSFGVARLEYMSENDNNPTRTAASSQNPTLSTTHFIRLNLVISSLTTAILVSGSTPPETYIPYLQPTDPPVPLPELATYQGENTLSCSEGLGEVSITGYIKEVSNG